jgi:ELWxxDGT repeat protein
MNHRQAGRSLFGALTLAALLVIGSVGSAAASTRRVSDIYPGLAGSDPEGLVALDGWLYFAATDPQKGRELWKTRGTAASTKRVMDICPGSCSSDPGELTRVGRFVYFSAHDPQKGRELWRTKGTPKYTKRVKDIRPGSEGSNPHNLTRIGSGTTAQLFFAADDGVHGNDLWRTWEKNRKRTELLELNDRPGWLGGDSDPRWITDVWDADWLVADADLEAGALVYGGQIVGRIQEPTWLTANGRNLYMSAPEPSSFGDDATRELWTSYAPQASEHLRKVIDIVPGSGGSLPEELTSIERYLYFSAADGVVGREPWFTKGWPVNTARFGDINPGAASSDPAGFTRLGKKIMFAATDVIRGRELWRNQLGRQNAWRVADINPGSGGSDPTELTRVGKRLFFAADNGTTGRELWRTAGSRSDTRQVRDIRSGGLGSDPHELTVVGNRLFFVADDGRKGNEVWVWAP